MKVNLTEQIEKLQSELDRLKELNSIGEPNFEVGKWYKCDVAKPKDVGFKGTSSDFILNKNGLGVCEKDTMLNYNLWKPATESEVCQAFKNHLEANGWTKGCKFKSAATGKSEYTYSGNIEFYAIHLYDKNNGCIFDVNTLTLAELVKEEKIMVGENIVEFRENRMILLNDSYFTDNNIKTLLPANPELFGKILKRMEEGK